MHLHFAHTFGFATRAVLLRKGCKLFSLTSGCQLGTDCSRAGAEGAEGAGCAHPMRLLPRPTAPGHSGSFVRGCCLCWPPAGEGLFAGSLLPCCTSLPSQPASQSTEANSQTSVEGSMVSTPTFPCIFFLLLVDSGKYQNFPFPCLYLL